MTKYAISEEGADAVELLSKKLLEASKKIDDNSIKLKNDVNAVSGELGIFREKIHDLINRNTASLDHYRDSIEYISNKTRKLSENIRELVHVGLGTAISASAIPTMSKIMESSSGAGADASSKSETIEPSGIDRELLKPKKGAIPRNLEKTQLSFHETSDGNLVYGDPAETNTILIQHQGEAYPDEYLGTCGLASSANVLRMSGVDVSEKDIIDYAANKRDWTTLFMTRDAYDIKKGTDFKDITNNGGTFFSDQASILKHFGVESEVKDNPTIENIANSVTEGRGVILGVNSDTLRKGLPNDGKSGHAVVPTGVKMDKLGKILGFFICDTAGKGGTTYYTAEKIQESLKGSMVVTEQIIR